MEPSTAVWAAARLAPLQVCVWGHPSTTGMASMDYYISSALFHAVHHYHHSHTGHSDDNGAISPVIRNSTAQDFFSEQLVQLDALGFYFERPALQALSSGEGTAAVSVNEAGALDSVVSPLIAPDDAFFEKLVSSLTGQTEGAEALRDMIQNKVYSGKKLVLCTQHLPKFHPDFDHILGQVLIRNSEALIVLIDNASKHQWRRTLEARWRKAFVKEVNAVLASSTLDELIALSGLHGRKLSGDSPLLNNSTETIDALLSRIVWLPSLNPQEYLALMASGDVMLDPFPFGGGVTALEALAVCTPVVTLPVHQNVPSLAAGMLSELHLPQKIEELLIVSDAEQYVKSVLTLTSEESVAVLAVRKAVCQYSQRIFSSQPSVREWEQFLVSAVHSSSS